MVKLICRVIS